jgi:hypothetical protein
MYDRLEGSAALGSDGSELKLEMASTSGGRMKLTVWICPDVLRPPETFEYAIDQTRESEERLGSWRAHRTEERKFSDLAAV